MAAVRGRIEEHRVDQAHREPVGDHGLLEHAPHDQHHAQADEDAVGIGRPLELRQEAEARTIGPATRCGKNEMKNMTSSSGRGTIEVAPVDVDDVGDALEGEERDADRQDDLEQRQLALDVQRRQQLVELIRQTSRSI